MKILRIVIVLIVIVFSQNLVEGASLKPDPIQLPVQTPLSSPELDTDNVPFSHLPNGAGVYNVFEVAMQAMEGKNWRSYMNQEYTGSGLVPRVSNPKGLDDSYQLAAYSWLENNADQFGQNGLIWYYRFPNVYNDVAIEPPWGSAFGQAHVIKAFMHAYRVTGDDKYRDLIMKAVVPFSMNISQGGFQTTLPDGHLFFEEIPVIPATHILNGHMISTATLLEVAAEFDIDWITRLAEKGVATLKDHLQDYDLGYWSRYDMNLKKGEILFRLRPEGSSEQDFIAIDRVIFSTDDSEEQVVLDVGGADDAVGAWRVSGIEWTATQNYDGQTTRSVIDGAAKHCRPVAGGSLQNSYVVMQLPVMQRSEMSRKDLYFLRIDYYDKGRGTLNVEIQDISHGNFMRFRSLSHGTIFTSGSKTWKSAFVPVGTKDLAWFMGPVYQAYHVKMLKLLHQLAGEEVFKVYADRWERYLAMHEEVNIEDTLSTRSDCNPH